MKINNLEIKISEIFTKSAEKVPIVQFMRMRQLIEIKPEGGNFADLQFFSLLAQIIAGEIAQKHPDSEIGREYLASGARVSEATQDEILNCIGTMQDLANEINFSEISKTAGKKAGKPKGLSPNEKGGSEPPAD